MPVPSPTDQPDPDLLARIPLAARTLLDVGCGTGGLAAAYRALNPRVRLLGIEPDPAAARQAADRLDQVVVAARDADPLPFDLPLGSVDCILYDEALTAVADPWAVLRRHAAVLQDDGVILWRVPNPAHWLVAAALLRGTTEPVPPSWCAFDGMRARSEAAGFVPYDVSPHGADRDQAQDFLDALAPTLERLGVNPATYAQRALPRRFVWRLRKHQRARLTVVATMLRPVGGVSDVRITLPQQAIASDPTVVARIVPNGEGPGPAVATPRIFVLHRPALSGASGLAMLQRVMADGWLVVTEFDDHPDFFDALLADPHQLSFRGVHALQTSTPAMAEVLRQRNPEIALFPNAIRALPEPRNFAALPALTLFFGALNREPDWLALLPAINAVAAEAGDRLRFHVVHDSAFFDALQTPHKQFTPTCDYDTYLRLLGSGDIAFMPLADTEFNRAKSDLKFIESAAARLAVLASHVVYGDSIVDGETGLVFRDAGELHTRLRRLVAAPDLALRLGEQARRYVARERMLAYQTADRIAWYRSLWARREALTRAVNDRMAVARRSLMGEAA